ncbi:MAG: subclass B3 metallo-beta-lactamase [Bryobacterales bacterium]|nr:subclass B3 metallo-beta-lactamase [Bryobacterales bacterium]
MRRFLFAASLLLAATAFAQRDNWEKPFPAHTIAGNLHYIGTADLGCYLITTPQGHIVINTGLESSVPQMVEGARKLGFKLEDAKILLTMQAHFDHTVGLAAIQRMSGAKMYATVADAPVLEDGGKLDDGIFKSGNRFPPIKVDRRLKDNDKITLGGTELTVISTPGHSRGSVSYKMSVTDKGKKPNVLIVNMPSVVMPLVGNKLYPNIVKDFEHTFAVLKTQKPDIWVAGHGSQFDLATKYQSRNYVDPDGYTKALANYEKLFRQTLAEEQSRKP